MTMPDERTRAILNTKRFLRSLLDRSATPGVPKHIREEAYWCLRHYPAAYNLDGLDKLDPDTWGKVDSSEYNELNLYGKTMVVTKIRHTKKKTKKGKK